MKILIMAMMMLKKNGKIWRFCDRDYKNYSSHLNMQELGKFNFKINVIPKLENM